jgi:uncharacterized protein YdeI (YjbR/CyaY-like superfamily)
LRRPLDAELHQQWFTPRKPKSLWSKPNRLRVARLIDQGAMTAAGLACVELAKRIGTWDALAHVDSLTPPKELRAALDQRPQAKRNWETMTPTARKHFLYWLANAKREATRGTRIKEIVGLVSRNVTLAQSRGAAVK